MSYLTKWRRISFNPVIYISKVNIKLLFYFIKALRILLLENILVSSLSDSSEIDLRFRKHKWTWNTELRKSRRCMQLHAHGSIIYFIFLSALKHFWTQTCIMFSSFVKSLIKFTFFSSCCMKYTIMAICKLKSQWFNKRLRRKAQ